MDARWEFDNINDSGEWRWLCILPGRGLRGSMKSFGTLWDCQQDAARNGYIPAPGDLRRAERRRIPQKYSKPPTFERRQQARAF